MLIVFGEKRDRFIVVPRFSRREVLTLTTSLGSLTTPHILLKQSGEVTTQTDTTEKNDIVLRIYGSEL